MSSSASSKNQRRPSQNGADGRNSTGGSSGRKRSAHESAGKRIQSYCLRYAIRVIDRHAKPRCDKEMISSISHTKEIFARVGKRLREEMMPLSYCKAEDPVLNNLDQSNKQRKTEIQSNKKTVDKLEKQLALTAEALKRARKQKEYGQKELNRIRKKQKAGDDELPAFVCYGINEKETVSPVISAVASSAHLDYKRAPVGTMIRKNDALRHWRAQGIN